MCLTMAETARPGGRVTLAAPSVLELHGLGFIGEKRDIVPGLRSARPGFMRPGSAHRIFIALHDHHLHRWKKSVAAAG